jgi:hypothetical protein
MTSSFHFILATLVGLTLIGIPLVFAIHLPSNDYDINLIDIKIVDLQTLSLDDTPGYYFDNSDLLKITINVTNNGVDYFLVSDKMFKIWVMEPDFKKSTNEEEVFEIVDNYYTSYDDELEVRYDNLQSRELFEECDYTNDRVRVGESMVFTLCYDVLRIWNNNQILRLEDSKKYYLVMMTINQATTCPNCKKILLSSHEFDNKYHFPEWIQNLFNWHNQGIVSDIEFQSSIKYLLTKGIISKDGDFIPATLEDKNQQLKEHQARLARAQQTNLYVSHMKFYESDYDEKILSGVLCKKQNNIVTLSADYTNDDAYYDTIFFKLLVIDEIDNVVSMGLSTIVDVVPKEFRHFEVSTPYAGKMNSCFIMIDSKFPQK